MTMGQTGMGDMADDAHAAQQHPDVGGAGPFGYITMGGMFTILKVRDDSRATTTRAGTSIRPAPWPEPAPPTWTATASTSPRRLGLATVRHAARSPARLAGTTLAEAHARAAHH